MSTLDPKALDALAFLYLSFGFTSDGTLTPDEMRTLAEKLRGWSPDTQLPAIGDVLKGAVVEFKSLSVDGRHARAQACVALVVEHTSETQRVQVLGDLQAIAVADGNLSDGEQKFIAGLARRFGLMTD